MEFLHGAPFFPENVIVGCLILLRCKGWLGCSEEWSCIKWGCRLDWRGFHIQHVCVLMEAEMIKACWETWDAIIYVPGGIDHIWFGPLLGTASQKKHAREDLIVLVGNILLKFARRRRFLVRMRIFGKDENEWVKSSLPGLSYLKFWIKKKNYFNSKFWRAGSSWTCPLASLVFGDYYDALGVEFRPCFKAQTWKFNGKWPLSSAFWECRKFQERSIKLALYCFWRRDQIGSCVHCDGVHSFTLTGSVENLFPCSFFC